MSESTNVMTAAMKMMTPDWNVIKPIPVYLFFRRFYHNYLISFTTRASHSETTKKKKKQYGCILSW